MQAKGVVGASSPQWIPVTERLPDNGVEVLIYSQKAGACADYFCDEVFGWPDVTHWMPLPEPPKAGD